ncbi:shikimate dehydrogenase [Psychrobium sp. MM17-31]|uniref:shikimate dehydrogenase n=1 Tax=Psychrobium sp. MM17-31 TaxID=2917758 RepID=UPI001EF600D9|nr:shikimate dehydrogenase [Psychrobium sp. MM17-31]
MDKYLVIGNPIAHSKSPYIHQSFAKETQQTMDYQKALVEIDDFEAFIQQFQAQGGRGCNITVPFKERAFELAGQLTPRAKAAGAVNTLIFQNDGIILGDNTDGQGLVGDLLNQGVELKSKRILIIGAGGAARGCILPLLEQAPTSITITNRTYSKAQQLESEFEHSALNSVPLSELKAEFDVIINSTSASLSNRLPEVEESVIATAHCCYDMAYGNEPTCFLTWAKDLGVAQTVDGLGMLVGQAAESFRLWRGVTPQTSKVLATLREQLS